MLTPPFNLLTLLISCSSLQPYPMYPATTSLVNVVPKLSSTGRDLLQVRSHIWYFSSTFSQKCRIALITCFFLISRTCWNVILSRGSLQKKPCSTLISQISVHLRFLIASCRHSAPRIAHPSPRRFIRTSHNTANPSDFQATPPTPHLLKFCCASVQKSKWLWGFRSFYVTNLLKLAQIYIRFNSFFN